MWYLKGREINRKAAFDFRRNSYTPMFIAVPRISQMLAHSHKQTKTFVEAATSQVQRDESGS